MSRHDWTLTWPDAVTDWEDRAVSAMARQSAEEMSQDFGLAGLSTEEEEELFRLEARESEQCRKFRPVMATHD